MLFTLPVRVKDVDGALEVGLGLEDKSITHEAQHDRFDVGLVQFGELWSRR